MEQEETINIKITCNASNTDNSESSKAAKINVVRNSSRPFKGHGWSGSKKQCRLKRQQKRQRFQCYAVAIGRNTGIFETWPECERNVSKYNDPLFKGFHNRVDAINWLKKQKSELQFDKSQHQQHVDRDTAIPTTPIQQNDKSQHHADRDAAIPTATAVPIDPPACAPIPRWMFSPVDDLVRLIVNYTVGGVSSPPSCDSPTCPYIYGDAKHIRDILMQRLYHVNRIISQLENSDHKRLWMYLYHALAMSLTCTQGSHYW